ncbi:DMT family transporter [Anoxybacterium hadale]|uniref:DMT family transporter n=1 Tax=Anoxybacterium hadale TaxID=3408580 RepID=A0ACD1ABX0_9FIRM|nr:DMT family transporter [Clostridiales bacterium]
MKKSYIQYIASLLLFGSNGVIASCIFLSSTEIVLTRTLIGGLTLLLFFVLSRQKIKLPEQKRGIVFVLLSGAAMGGSWIFLYKAYTLVGVGVATIVYYCGPVFVMVLSTMVFREKMTLGKFSGFLAVVAGIYLSNGQSLFSGDSPLGLLCSMMAAVMYTLMILFSKKSSFATSAEGHTGSSETKWECSQLGNTVCQLGAAFLTTALFLTLHRGISVSIESKNLLPILILGVVNTGIGCLLYFSSISKLPVQSVAICGYLEPLSALVFSALFLGESLNSVQMIGVFLVLGGALFGEITGIFQKKQIDSHHCRASN